MKLRPSQRRAEREKLGQADSDIARWEKALEKFKPGTPPHEKVRSLIEDAKTRKSNAEYWLGKS